MTKANFNNIFSKKIELQKFFSINQQVYCSVTKLENSSSIITLKYGKSTIYKVYYQPIVNNRFWLLNHVYFFFHKNIYNLQNLQLETATPLYELEVVYYV